MQTEQCTHTIVKLKKKPSSIAPNLQHHHCFHRLSEISVLGVPIQMACKTEYLDKSFGAKLPVTPLSSKQMLHSVLAAVAQSVAVWPELAGVQQAHVSLRCDAVTPK